MSKTVYVYVCESHEKLGKFSRELKGIELAFFKDNTDLHLAYCQVKGCQFQRDRVIELTFNRINDDLELVSEKKTK